MPLPVLINVASTAAYFPTKYYIAVGIALLALAILRAYAQGRSTGRDRDLHGRVILLTGAFTPLGSTLLETLARRGAHIIALTHLPVSSSSSSSSDPDAGLPIESSGTALIIEALRETTKNTHIFAETCALTSVASTRAFCTRFLTGKEHRLDAIIFAHEYEHVGPLSLFGKTAEEKRAQEELRMKKSDCTFLMTTLLLPTLLVAPPERDIRIINVVNPFYAAAIPHFLTSSASSSSPSPPPSSHTSTFLREGTRALRTIILTRHLQRIFDALPQAPAPDPESAARTVTKSQKSNIVAVSVSPGFSRQDTLAPLLRANFANWEFSGWGMLLYMILQPLLRIFAKTPTHAVQSVLHALFLPTPFKFASTSQEDSSSTTGSGSGTHNNKLRPREEALKPGALYADCSVVRLPLLAPKRNTNANSKSEKGVKNKEGTMNADAEANTDDGEYGGEEMGRLIWESFEEALKKREKEEAEEEEEDVVEPLDKKND